MSVFLSKLLSLVIHPLPLGLLVVAAGAGSTFWNRRAGVAAIGVGVLILWVPSMPLFSDWAQGTIEQQHLPRPMEEVPDADAIVTLGGSVGAPVPPRLHPDLNGTADRVWHAARLYRAEKAPLIVASGGTLPWRDQTFREAPAMRDLLVSWGVPSDSVLMESESANTYENATGTAELAEEHGIEQVLLVTSALHMRRALATFRATGLEVIPAATDHQVVTRRRTLLDLFPDAGALQGSTATLREYVGYLVYDWRGWIA